eukprot:scaffold21885_cov39-Tisochrysis_lutea.AAC.2
MEMNDPEPYDDEEFQMLKQWYDEHMEACSMGVLASERAMRLECEMSLWLMLITKFRLCICYGFPLVHARGVGSKLAQQHVWMAANTSTALSTLDFFFEFLDINSFFIMLLLKFCVLCILQTLSFYAFHLSSCVSKTAMMPDITM